MPRRLFALGLIVFVIVIVSGSVWSVMNSGREAAVWRTPAAATSPPVTEAPTATTAPQTQSSQMAPAAPDTREQLKALGYVMVSSKGGKEIWKYNKPSPTSPTLTLGASKLTVTLPNGVACQASEGPDVAEALITQTYTADTNKASLGLNSTPQAGVVYQSGPDVPTNCWWIPR